MSDKPQADSVRLDKWLWAARFFKTRSKAVSEIEAGHVRFHGERTKPSREVRVGDLLEIRMGIFTWVVTVQVPSDVRGGAPVAQTLYRETEESQRRRAELILQVKAAPGPAERRGRPTKRERRQLERFTGR
ncbi:MAG: RNA-binding S4 domain-containing protein [Burkholderiaceae bacterium]|jgi:ribosome-associated heat shock protein Hsp15